MDRRLGSDGLFQFEEVVKKTFQLFYPQLLLLVYLILFEKLVFSKAAEDFGQGLRAKSRPRNREHQIGCFWEHHILKAS